MKMGFISGILKRLIKLILYLAVLVVFIVLVPNLPPYTKFTRIELEPTLPRVGTLAPNDFLNNAKHLYTDKLLGPEAFQIWNGEVYTGLATGEIVKISPGGHITFVAQIGRPCTGLVHEHICGRPLGFQIDELKKLMYVADAYYGIWTVNLITNKKQLLVSPQVAVDGIIPKFFNSLTLDNNGGFYWTDSSSDFTLRDGVMTTLSDPSGRLFHYNSAKNISKVLLEDLWFPNGLVVSPDNQYVVVAESSRYRLVKYYISGPKKGSSEVFLAGLPGVPDNIRSLPDGSGMLVALHTVFDEEHPLICKSMSSAPLARKFIARLMRLVEIPFEFLHSQFPNHIFENIIYQIGSFGTVAIMIPEQSGLVHIDWNGNIIASYYNTEGLHMSDAIVFNNNLYIGAPHLQNFIGAIPAPPQLIKAFTAKKESVKEPTVKAKLSEQGPPKVEETKEIPKNTKPVTQPPKQTTQPTTTQKPTTKSNNIPKEKVVRQNSVPKEAKLEVNKVADKQKEDVVKPKVVAKATEPKATVEGKTDGKHNVVQNQREEKPKMVPNNAGAKPKVESRESDTKPKVAPQAEAKEPKVAQKDAAPKMNAEPQKIAEPTPIIKNPQEKPVAKETKPKILKDDVKEKENSKGPEKPKVVKDQPDIKVEKKTSAPTSESQNAKIKPKPTKTDNESAKKASKSAPAIKPIPVKEDIPSDTLKPQKETLKVITKSGPQEIPNPQL